MSGLKRGMLLLGIVAVAWGQAPTAEEIREKAIGSVAQVLVARDPAGRVTAGAATAFVVKPNGVLLTAWHVVRDATAVQVRFKNGERFDAVQLLGVDERRDVAALKIPASGLAVLPAAQAGEAKEGGNSYVLGNPQGMSYTLTSGIVSALRPSEEVRGLMPGYRVIQFTAGSYPGSSGGVLLSAWGRVLGLVVGGLPGAQGLNFAVPIESVLGLADEAPMKRFASGARLTLPGEGALPEDGTLKTRGDSEKSELLATAKDKNALIKGFKTMAIHVMGQSFFGTPQLKAALGRTKGFEELRILIVDDVKVADVVLEVGFTAPWDYPFSLKHQTSTVMLVSGKGTGPFSGVAGASSVASEFVKLLKPNRQ